jgi:hypothetical protein
MGVVLFAEILASPKRETGAESHPVLVGKVSLGGSPLVPLKEKVNSP